MTTLLIVCGLVTAAGAVAAMSFRNLIHCTFALVGCFLGLAGVYVLCGAAFVGLIQVFVYAGAVAILVVFAILLTGSGGLEAGPLAGKGWVVGASIGGLVLGMLVLTLVGGEYALGMEPVVLNASVRAIGEELMTEYVLPLQVAGLLLTSALIGAAMLAMPDRKDRS